MTTEAQVEANRINAQKSTGPRTPEGKAKVAQNALKHGLLAKEAVVIGEDLDQFDLLRDHLRAELAPVGVAESLLVERIAGAFWRLQRAERFGTEAFDMMYMQCRADPQNKRWQPVSGPEGVDPIFGLTVVKDFSQTRVLERLTVCERRIEGSLYRTMAELRQAQERRQGTAGASLGDRRARRSRRQEDRGGPFHRVRETPPPDFTLNDLLAKIAATEEGPGSPAAEVRGWEPHQTRTDAFGNPDEPADAGTNMPPDPSCDNASLPGVVPATKPISDEVSSVAYQVPSESCETKPISEPPTADAAAEPVCETKPISVGPEDNQVPGGEKAEEVGRGHPTCEELPAGVRTNVPQAHGSSCETKPIAVGPKRERFAYTPIFRRRR
jgi:hypothetical protein